MKIYDLVGGAQNTLTVLSSKKYKCTPPKKGVSWV